jgi:hypothetical protein
MSTIRIASIILLAAPLNIPAQSQPKGSLPSLPPAPVRPVTDEYFGTKVVDPYRYMENLNDLEVQSWMKAQNDYTRAVLASIPGRAQILDRLRELDKSAPADISDVRRNARRCVFLSEAFGRRGCRQALYAQGSEWRREAGDRSRTGQAHAIEPEQG